MIKEVLILIFLTLLPFLELRASIPYGIFNTEIHWVMVFFVCFITNAILGPVIYIFIDRFIHWFLFIKFVDNLYKKIVIKTRKKVHDYVERYGELGIAVFIGIPLPGSGSYSGALAAYLIGMNLKRFIIANIIGVLIAGIIVTIISITGSESLKLFIKII